MSRSTDELLSPLADWPDAPATHTRTRLGAVVVNPHVLIWAAETLTQLREKEDFAKADALRAEMEAREFRVSYFDWNDVRLGVNDRKRRHREWGDILAKSKARAAARMGRARA